MSLATVTIQYTIADWPCELTVDSTMKADAVSRAIDASAEAVKVLAERGAKPTAVVTPATGATNANGANDGAPVCQYHGAMKPSTKQPGAYFCPNKMGDGSYCKEKA